MRFLLVEEDKKKDNYLAGDTAQEVDSLGNPLTQEQINYFRNSKVRDKQGNLLVCIHYTNNEFDTFDKSYLGSGAGTDFGVGFYFSAIDKDWYGDIKMECYLNITNPYHLDVWSDSGRKEFFKLIKRYVNQEDIDYYTENGSKIVDNLGGAGFINEFIGQDTITNLCVESGYDGIIVGDMGDGEIIAFEPNQIKLITNTNPTSGNNTDILKQSRANESMELNEDISLQDKHAVREFARECREDGLPLMDYKEFSEVLNEQGMKPNEELYQVYVDEYKNTPGGYDRELEIVDKIVAEFKKMSTEQIVKLVNIPHEEQIDPDSPMFILPNGTIVSVKKVGENLGYDTSWIHGDLMYIILDTLANNLGLYYPTEMEDAENNLLEYLTNKLGWARINTGTTWTEDRFYCVLPKSMTSAQFRSLEKWIEWGYDNKKGNDYVMICLPDTNYTYLFKDNFPEDIIKKIKRYYSSGRLYEDVNNKDLLSFIYENLPLQKEMYWWSTFILPDGSFINLDEISEEYDSDEHQVLFDYLYDNGYSVTETDVVDGLGFIKLNPHYPYIGLSDRVRPTSHQYHTLENWLDNAEGEFGSYSMVKMENHKMLNPIAVFKQSTDKVYDLGVVTPNDIVKAIQKSYSSGILESRNELKESMNDIDMNIHPQVAMQLDYLRRNAEDKYNKGSRREYENIYNYKEYQKEIDRDGDKNLLVMGKLKDPYEFRGMFGVKPFARRYRGSDLLVHRPGTGGEILVHLEDINIIDTVNNKLKESIDITNEVQRAVDNVMKNKSKYRNQDDLESVIYSAVANCFSGMHGVTRDTADMIADVYEKELERVGLISLTESINFGDRVKMDHYSKVNNGATGTCKSKIGKLCVVEWDDGSKSNEITSYLTKIDDEKINESNELEQRAKKHKKKSKGMGWHMAVNAGDVEKGIEVFNNSTGDLGSGDTGMSMGESIDDKLYYYDGPIYYRGHKITDVSDIYTTAKSLNVAIRNVLYKATKGDKEELYHYEIVDDMVKEVPKNETPKVRPKCPTCGYELNDIGDCPVCDYGEDDLLESLSDLEALWQLSKLD